MKSQRILALEKKARKKDSIRRFLNRNIDAMRFCLKNGLTIFPASQSSSVTSVKLFVQKGEKYKPLSNKLYNQEEPQEVIEYVADIDREYERIYLKMKDKVKRN